MGDASRARILTRSALTTMLPRHCPIRIGAHRHTLHTAHPASGPPSCLGTQGSRRRTAEQSEAEFSICSYSAVSASSSTRFSMRTAMTNYLKRSAHPAPGIRPE